MGIQRDRANGKRAGLEHDLDQSREVPAYGACREAEGTRSRPTPPDDHHRPVRVPIAAKRRSRLDFLASGGSARPSVVVAVNGKIAGLTGRWRLRWGRRGTEGFALECPRRDTTPRRRRVPCCLSFRSFIPILIRASTNTVLHAQDDRNREERGTVVGSARDRRGKAMGP